MIKNFSAAIIFIFMILMPGILLSVHGQENYQPEFSTAGFYALENSSRKVYSMNPAWRFHRGPAEDAFQPAFDDSDWQVVSLPHGTDYLPEEGSGGVNYQGEIWYRKHFNADFLSKDKKVMLHFEAIMGKSKIWVNGTLLKENFGGFLPVVADISDYIKYDSSNIIAVWADNSDDADYPPGKPQNMLDFCYFGGIYRDCWLISHNKTYISDPNLAGVRAGGGLFTAIENVSNSSAEVLFRIHLINELKKEFKGEITYKLVDKNGKIAGVTKGNIRINAQKSSQYNHRITVKNPRLWSPENPDLYTIEVNLTDSRGKHVDGFRQRLGIRSIEFKGKDGLWLNGKPYPQPLIGANRHQDFAIVGNAVSNSLHWRDAKKLREAGFKVIRNAHYPQDPAFMDACDELGLFVIVNTPGWQFWNEKPVFEQRIYQNIRDMVRRDRNHPCVFLWEPVLNETWYPENFARMTREIVMEEYPFSYCETVCDSEALGHEYFNVLYTHPKAGDQDRALQHTDHTKTYFTREWGDNVDDWNSHNSPSRVRRSWGEIPMLIQAQHYANPPYRYTSLNTLYSTDRQHIGGCLWHPFDHNRGYHPDPFYGGVMDAFRQKKTAWHMFRSQRSPEDKHSLINGGPMVYIAHEMTPFSPADVTVYSNCDKVKLSVFKGGKVYLYKRDSIKTGLKYPAITFKDAYHFIDDKWLAMAERHDEVYLLAEGLIGGKVVASHKVFPARRPAKIILSDDLEGNTLLADGSDMVTVTAAITDEMGNIKRLNNEKILFEVQGEGRLIGNGTHGINPADISWGTAAVLLKTTHQAGEIIITASVLLPGIHKPVRGELRLNSSSVDIPLIYNKSEIGKMNETINTRNSNQIKDPEMNPAEMNERQREIKERLREVEQQQKDFGEGKAQPK